MIAQGQRTDRLFDSGDIQFERLPVRPRLLGDAAVIVDVELVFDKIGGKDDDLLPGIEDRFQGDIQRPAGATGHNDVPSGNRPPGMRRDRRRHRRPRLFITGVAHIAVHAGNGRLGQSAQFASEGFWRLHRRIPQCEIEDVLRSMDQPQLFPFFEHLANPRGALDAAFHLLRYGHAPTPLS